jgi:hypothetical protein
MQEVKRGPGRPPKVRPEAIESDEPVAAATVEAAPEERMIEVELLRKYAPAGQDTEVLKTVPVGTVIKVPQQEAMRLLKAQYACGTERTFD